MEDKLNDMSTFSPSEIFGQLKDPCEHDSFINEIFSSETHTQVI